MQTIENRADTTDIAVFSRLLTTGKRKNGPQLARYLLGLGFSETDQVRMQQLADKNQAGSITPQERDELFTFVKAGHLLAILHSKHARRLRRRNSFLGRAHG